MTLRQLIEVPSLGIILLAGQGGLDRHVGWAHTCEVERPWEWMGAQELLMTTGGNMPTSADSQVEFLRQLDKGRLSGLVLADGMNCPALTAQAEEVASELKFSVLEQAYGIPFVAIARTIADASLSGGHSRLTRVLRIYEAYRHGIETGQSDASLLDKLSLELGVEVNVFDVRTGDLAVRRTDPLPEETLNVVRDTIANGHSLPAVTRLRAGAHEYTLLPVGTGGRWILVAKSRGQDDDQLALRHVSTLLTIGAERQRAVSEARLSATSRLLWQLVDGLIDGGFAKDQLAEFGLDEPPWYVLSIQTSAELNPLMLQKRLLDLNVPNLVTFRARSVLVLTSATDETVVAVEGMMPPDGHLGVSSQVMSVNRIRDAAREAAWAIASSAIEGRRVARYFVDRPLFLPRTVAEAEDIISRVLGSLIQYDAEHHTELTRSLQVFFDTNRSWQLASQELAIHKQTLVYRMRRVGEITGRELDDLDDISELHLALRTLRFLRDT